MTRHTSRVIGLLAVCLSFGVGSERVRGQGDPMELQSRAIQRLDAFVETFRKTGDVRSRMPDLAQAEAELSASNRMLAARGDWSALALGLIKQGHVYRIQGQWQASIPFYSQAEEAARRGNNVARQSDALAWRGLAEISLRNAGQAVADAAQAVRLAETTSDRDILAQALDVLGAAQLAQGDLAAAAATLNREVAVAAEAKNPMASYFAYLNRADLHKKTAERCDYATTYDQCLQALDRARADYQQTRTIANGSATPPLQRRANSSFEIWI